MKGAFFLGAQQERKFEVREMEFPDVLGPHQVLVKNMACGICGTDVHIYHGEKGSAEVVPPVVLGHEYSGIVEKVGSQVTSVKPGDHVALDPNMYCGLCRPCRMGRKQNCKNLFALGVNVNGGFAEYSLCPDTQCWSMKMWILTWLPWQSLWPAWCTASIRLPLFPVKQYWSSAAVPLGR